MADSQRYVVMCLFVFRPFHVIYDNHTNKFYGHRFRLLESAETVARLQSFAWKPGWHTYDELKAKIFNMPKDIGG